MRDYLEWLASCGPSSPTIATSKELIRHANCLNLVLEYQGNPREMPSFSPYWNPEKVGSNTGKGKAQ